MKMGQCILFIGILLFGCFASRNIKSIKRSDCSIMKSGKFISPGLGEKSNTIVIKNGAHTEYDYRRKYTTRSKMTWLSDCTFELKILKTNYTDRPFKVNDKMIVDITRVEGQYVYFNAKYNGMTITDTLMKVGN